MASLRAGSRVILTKIHDEYEKHREDVFQVIAIYEEIPFDIIGNILISRVQGNSKQEARYRVFRDEIEPITMAVFEKMLKERATLQQELNDEDKEIIRGGQYGLM